MLWIVVKQLATQGLDRVPSHVLAVTPKDRLHCILVDCFHVTLRLLPIACLKIPWCSAVFFTVCLSTNTQLMIIIPVHWKHVCTRPGLKAIHTDQFSGTSSRCQSTCTSKLACVSCHWYQNFTGTRISPVSFNIAHVLFVCRQLAPETGTGYWYQKTGQCVWPLRLYCKTTHVHSGVNNYCPAFVGTQFCQPTEVVASYTPMAYMLTQSPGQILSGPEVEQRCWSRPKHYYWATLHCHNETKKNKISSDKREQLSLIHIWRCRRRG